MPELTHLRVLLDLLRARLSELHTKQEGYSTETAIIVAIIGVVAIALATAIVAAIARRTSVINGF
jgi:hypothetical protein